jgi:hypothetical protein
MSNRSLCLCAHVAYGERHFDIAIRCDDMGTLSDPGPWYIINSGHRIRPYWAIPFDHSLVDAAGDPPDDAEESWSLILEAQDNRGILELIGLAPKPPEPLRRL